FRRVLFRSAPVANQEVLAAFGQRPLFEHIAITTPTCACADGGDGEEIGTATGPPVQGVRFRPFRVLVLPGVNPCRPRTAAALVEKLAASMFTNRAPIAVGLMSSTASGSDPLRDPTDSRRTRACALIFGTSPLPRNEATFASVALTST